MSAGWWSISTTTVTSFPTASIRTSAAPSPPPTKRWRRSTPAAASMSTPTATSMPTDANPFADGSRGDLVNDIAQGVGSVIQQQDGNLFGKTGVYLDGRRVEVRTEETNLGDLTADANLWYAQQTRQHGRWCRSRTAVASATRSGVSRRSAAVLEFPPRRTRRRQAGRRCFAARYRQRGALQQRAVDWSR